MTPALLLPFVLTASVQAQPRSAHVEAELLSESRSIEPGKPAASIGSAAPDFSAADTEGRQIKLSSYAGKPAVLEWLNYDCPFVKRQYGTKNMQRLQKAYGEKGVVWLSVVSSAPGKQGHYTAKELDQMSRERDAHPAAIVLDSDGKVGRLFGAKTTPHMFVIDPKGKLVYAGAIDDKPSTDLEDAPPATNYVTEALDAVLAGKPVKTTYTKSYGCSVKY